MHMAESTNREHASDLEETFLSDVHIGHHVTVSEGTTVSRFPFTLSCNVASGSDKYQKSSVGDSSQGIEVDEDGDLVLRRKHSQYQVLLIEHAMSTPLEAVGKQVWSGAMLMADYLVHSDKLQGSSVMLELGGGVGLVSIVAALAADLEIVFCTDVGRELLDLCQRNVQRNLANLDHAGSVVVRELDWKQPFWSQDGPYSWSSDDLKYLERMSLILATDVVYDDHLTDAFFSCLVHLHTWSRTPATILISLEKRINFTLEDLAPASPAYKHFRQCLRKQYPFGKGTMEFSATQLSTDFPQYFHYERTKELELWEIKPIISADHTQ